MTTLEPTNDLEEAETSRLSRRDGIRRQAAEQEMARAPLTLLSADLQASQRRVDEATDQHQATTGPLQAELQRLEQRAVQLIASREPADTVADARRSEIIALIAETNRTLEEVIRAETKTRHAIAGRISNLSCQHPDPSIILARLAQPGLASAKLLIKKHVAEQRARCAQIRLESARKSLAVHEANVAGILSAQRVNQRAAESPYGWGRDVGQPVPRDGDLCFERRMCDSWTAEIAVARAEHDVAFAAVATAHQEMLDE